MFKSLGFQTFIYVLEDLGEKIGQVYTRRRLRRMFIYANRLFFLVPLVCLVRQLKSRLARLGLMSSGTGCLFIKCPERFGLLALHSTAV